MYDAKELSQQNDEKQKLRYDCICDRQYFSSANTFQPQKKAKSTYVPIENVFI
ncbi:hypothetical protein SAMN02745196_00668 [Clostridium collagenovorans DSM 3089]|uniref:Uncharacterized protein n=1 Tax=Clostridium collagenovorans DSM 3089 TaxID=1121306 RepID=A0A1M5TQ36_9CLOT|nr:hypothetical protein [Clostridium collagenovorans]SHH52706.1 hypothetical protein SAMN02745196_00668 [Clostridium collagenovorans DSM 3089]